MENKKQNLDQGEGVHERDAQQEARVPSNFSYHAGEGFTYFYGGLLGV